MNRKKLIILLIMSGIVCLVLSMAVACQPAYDSSYSTYDTDGPPPPVLRFVDEEYDIACWYRGESLWCIDLANR